MAQAYSRKSLAQHIANDGDSASAAALFNHKIDFIEKEQKTPQYLNYLSLFLKARDRKEIRREVETADKEAREKVAIEKTERISEDENLQDQIDTLKQEVDISTIYPISAKLNPVADSLGAVAASRLKFVLGRLNPIENFYPILPLNRLGESDIVTRLGNPFSHRLRSS